MPHYMLLICNPTEGLSPEEAAAEHPRWMAYTQALSDAGAFVSGDALQPVATATTIRVRDGERLVSDGPFAETKEWLAGYYLLDCPDLDTATQQAARIPAARHGAIEVRPVMEIPGM